MQRMETQFYLLTDKVMRFNKILLIMLKGIVLILGYGEYNHLTM